ncbi:hypothetical protein SAMN04488511_12345 [Pedobacter suwonensis]|uniref:Outer membrane protein beta-barrel domain-containing protein n=1 Tax=Pedobacter suwonensis TaxID=332999 RepID=A0A1I0U6S3_9SPHI|nr:outer membrane beta-barrel protein [Pedobacter suwonensis]SFA59758.1 hypothetical protein SAMN04488511_12345 [Pedobacter suwonensis]
MDKELIEQITAQLQNHEEAYSNGAWERFSEKEKKKRGIAFWPLWAAAALIFIVAGVFFTLNNTAQKQMVVITKPKVKSDAADGGHTDTHSKNDLAQLNNNTNPSTNLITGRPIQTSSIAKPSTEQQNNYSLLNASETLDQVNHNLLENKLSAINLSGLKSKPFEILTEKKTQPIGTPTDFEKLLAHDSYVNQQKPADKSGGNSKWQPDVYVAPAMGNDNKVTMNYGFSLSYAIANKLSISSGVSYASISTTESLNATAPQTLSGKNLASVDAKVRGINVPLELKYNISDKLYTNVGVSALAVLNNSQQNSYIVNQVQSFSAPAVNGYADSKTMIVQEKKVEPQPEANIDPDKYIGFYNFSLGYKQKISKKNNIAIEPFLRLPMKTFSKENLNLTNGGLRLKIDF